MTTTKAERTELLQLIRKRERVMRSQARDRSIQMLADFEGSISKIYHFDNDPVWKKAMEQAVSAVNRAKEEIQDRCRELGIPPEFAPDVNVSWYGRGQNMMDARRRELRMAAKARIEATETETIAKIERMSLGAQEALIGTGDVGETARMFLQELPSIDALMPPVDVMAVQSMIEAKHSRRQGGYGE